MSSGAMVPISTRARLSRNDCCASCKDWRCTARLLIAKTRSQYAFLTLRVVTLMDWFNCTSEISRFLRVTSTCWRVASILKLRSSGCV
jgi:hypothetical protein